MEFFGIGPLELISILLIVFIVMGPGDMVKMGRTLGRALRNFRNSELWGSFNDATRQLRELPRNLMRETGMEELDSFRQEFKGEINDQQGKLDELSRQFRAWTRDPEPQSQKTGPKSETKEKPES
jgi:Sec-independent protein translocase protein TatA